MTKFELFQSNKNQQWYFHLKAGNGEIICQSEGYKSKQSAEKGIRSVKENASSAKVVEFEGQPQA